MYKTIELAKYVLLLCLCSTKLGAQEKCVFALDLIRHGDRAPMQALPNAIYTGDTPLGELTPQGKKKLHKMGEELRLKYVRDYQLLPETYQPKTMLVRSSSIERAIESAEGVLQGLYPDVPTKRQTILEVQTTEKPSPIAIHILPSDQDPLIPCQTEPGLTREMREKHLNEDPEWQAQEKLYAKDFKAWEKATGYRINNLYAVGRLADTIMVYQDLNIPLPEQLTTTQIQDILQLREQIYVSQSHCYPMACNLGTPLIQTIEKYLISGYDDNETLKYVLMSGHDVSILYAAGALGATLPYSPGYRARLSFRVIADEAWDKTIHVFYDEKPLALPGCVDNVCSFSQFREVIRKAERQAEPVCQVSRTSILMPTIQEE